MRIDFRRLKIFTNLQKEKKLIRKTAENIRQFHRSHSYAIALKPYRPSA